MDLQVVAFDFDGTLVDSTPGIVRCMERTVAALGLSPETTQAWSALIGLPVADQLRRVLPSERQGEVEAGVELYRSFYFQLSEAEVGRPFPGIAELLDALRGRARLAIATSKSLRGVQRVLRSLGWAALFDPVVTPELVARPKPHPESLQAILAQHGVLPGRAVFIGDSRFDIEMARAAQVPGWGVGWGVHPCAVLAEAGAARCFLSPMDLRTALLDSLRCSA